LRELGAGDLGVFGADVLEIVAPGCASGWVEHRPELQPLLINAKQAMDTCTNTSRRSACYGFLTGGTGEPPDAQRAEYKRARRRCTRRCAALPATSPDGPTPDGDSLWVTLGQRRPRD